MIRAQHPAFAAFLDWLRAAGRQSTATAYEHPLSRLDDWLRSQGIDAERATTDDLRRFQVWLSGARRLRDGEPLARTTQATCIIVVKSAYAWLARQGRILVDPASDLVIPRSPRALTVAKEHLSQQEAHAVIETAAILVAESKPATTPWAIASRNLALIALAIATGRRCLGLISLRLTDVDRERDELRVEFEKGLMGRVLPVAEWATAAIDRYLAGPRQRLLHGKESPWLFVSQRAEQLCVRGYTYVLDGLIAEAAGRNPDLPELASKRISTHSLRVTFAKLLHDHGCSIRSLNELMLHRSLETTAAYTPISVDDLRRALLPLHPRA